MKEILTACGGEEFVPLFAKRNLTLKELRYMNEKDFKEVKMLSNLNLFFMKNISAWNHK